MLTFSKIATLLLCLSGGVAAFEPRPNGRIVSPQSYIRADAASVEPLASTNMPSTNTRAIAPMGGFDRDASGDLIGSIYSGYQVSNVSGPQHGRSWVQEGGDESVHKKSLSDQDVFTAEPIYVQKKMSGNLMPDDPFAEPTQPAPRPSSVSDSIFSHTSVYADPDTNYWDSSDRTPEARKVKTVAAYHQTRRSYQPFHDDELRVDQRP